MRYSNFISTLFLPLLVSSASAAQEPQYMDAYPACDYSVLQTLVTSKRVKRLYNELRGPEVDQAFNAAKRKLRSEIGVEGAYGIILTSKNVTSVKTNVARRHVSGLHNDYYVNISAEIVNYCEPDSEQTPKVAPVLADGSKGYYIRGIEKHYEYRIPDNFLEKAITPDVTDYAITFDGGLYGVKLGESAEKVISTLGSPSVNIYLENNIRLLGFGRRNWFVFELNELKSISSGELLDLSFLDGLSIGYIRGERGEGFKIFDNNLVVGVSGETISKVLMLESVINNRFTIPVYNPSNILGVSLGQDAQTAASSIKGEVFTFYDAIEIETPQQTINLIIDEADSQKTVSQAEFVLH